LALMTRNEWLILILAGAGTVMLLVYVWPQPDPYADSARIEREVLEKFLKEQRPKNPRKWKSEDSGALLKDMEEAARRMAEQFGPARDGILQRAVKGELEPIAPYEGELPFPEETVIVHMTLEADGVPTTDRKKGRARVRIGGLESTSFENAAKTGTDYERLAAVLAALETRRRSDRGEGIAVLLVPAAFVPFEDVKKAVEAAARAGVLQVRLRQSPIPD
jgi:hypothetical protein